MNATIWDVQRGEPVATLTGHEDQFKGFSFSSDGRRLVSWGRDGVMVIWCTQGRHELLSVRGYDRKRDSLDDVWFSPDRRRIIAATGHGFFVFLSDSKQVPMGTFVTITTTGKQ